jgi:PAS domain S-box-containing protein
MSLTWELTEIMSASPQASSGVPGKPNGRSASWLDGGGVVVDEQQQVLRLDDTLARWLGVNREKALGQPILEVLAPRFASLPEHFQQLLKQPEGGAFELEVVHSDPVMWVRCEVMPGPGCCFVRFGSVLPTLEELSEGSWDQHLRSEAARREMFLRLLRAEAQLESITKRWPGVIFSQRADYSFSFASPRIEELTGCTVDQLRQQPGLFWRLVHEADAEDLQAQWRRLDRKNPSVSASYRIRHATTGRVAYILEQREAIFSENGLLLGYEGVWLDVTRQTIAERRLSSAAWKETIAVLTMGLAHDFSNIMAGIHSLSEAFGAEVDTSHPFHEGLALIRQNAMQASYLVRRILSLHNDKVGEQNYHNLNDIVTDTVDLMRKTMTRRVEIRTKLDAAQLPLYVDAVELRQVIINLIINAVDAMPHGGVLELSSTVHRELPEEKTRLGQVGRLPAVCLAVSDNGCGIPSSKLEAIFDPFFTTKSVNKGSGLGLYNSKLFVEKHHGAISVESQVSKGTTFRIWLPLADFTENDRVAVVGLPVRHTILVLGNPGNALDLMVQYLREHGIYVVVCLTSETAHEALGSPQYQFAATLGFSDQDSGWIWTFFEELRKNHPQLKTAVQVVGCNVDELSTRSLTGADIVFLPDTAASEVLARLQTILSERHVAAP